MQGIQLELKSQVEKTVRLVKLCSMFDLEISGTSVVNLHIGNVDLQSKRWNVGLIVGASGSGKSSIKKKIFSDVGDGGNEWQENKSIIDSFNADLKIEEIVSSLCAVGFSSPPNWIRPYSVLSNGEKFRADLAKILSEKKDLVVIDEFTSVVDRNVAKISSHCVQKTIRANDRQFVAVSCHRDIIDWLDPDWIIDTDDMNFFWRRLHGRPAIKFNIRKCDRDKWKRFSRFHYLNHDIAASAKCYVGSIDGVDVAFGSYMHFPHPKSKNIKREHRIVCLPDYQGIGIGTFISQFMASMCVSMGYRYLSTTSHPAMTSHRNKKKSWELIRDRSLSATIVGGLSKKHKATRLTTTYAYCGPAMDRNQAEKMFYD